MADMTLHTDRLYVQYAMQAVSGEIVVGKWVKLACQRFLDWFNRDDLRFDYEGVDKKIRLIQKLKLREGGNFILLPYQAWIVAGIYGFYYKESGSRVVSNVLLLTARKSGKSTFAAALAIVGAIADGVSTPEIAFIANSAKQAGMLFKYCSELCKSIDPNHMLFKRMRSDIKIPVNNGQINVLSSDTSKLDGRSDSMFLQDEGHAAKSFELWNVLKTGQGARPNPLAISISTAGFNVGDMYPLYNQWSYCCKILSGDYDDDSWFSAIFQIDKDDDWKDESVWVKANPSLGITVSYDYMRSQIRSAINTPSNEVSIKTKNLNMWCQSKDVWIPSEYIDDVSMPVDLADFEDEVCYDGVDLSSVSDLTSFSIMFPPNPDREKWPDKYVFKSVVYVPQEAIDNSVNSEIYQTFKHQKQVKVTSGNVVDYDYILADILSTTRSLSLEGLYYDEYNATQFAINATEEGLPLDPYSQGLGNFNRPTKYFEMLVKSGKVVIDSNACVKWAFSNVELKYDHNENCKPTKANGDKSKKIDPVISMLQALGGYLLHHNYSDGQVYAV